MADFITLTNARTDTGVRFETPIRIRPEHIVGYASGLGGKYYIVGGGENTLCQGTYVDTTAGEGTYFVSETPEQIDALLGVTDSNTASIYRAALEQIAQSPKRLPDEEDAEGWSTLASDRREIARAALSKSGAGA